MAYNDWTLDDGRVIQLITPDTLKNLDKGTKLICINGSTYTVGVDVIDDDTRGGLLAFGHLKRGDDW